MDLHRAQRRQRRLLGVQHRRGLLKWTGILGGVGGLLGAGGLWGLDRLAGGVARDRRTSMGLGMSIGGYRAFGTDFGRLLDTGAYLANINAMETNLAQQSPPLRCWGASCPVTRGRTRSR